MTAALNLWPAEEPLAAGRALDPGFWLDELHAGLPRRLFSDQATADIQQLCVLARTLLCLPDGVAPPPPGSRLERALAALLDSPLWPDLLATQPQLLPTTLPLLHLRARLGIPSTPPVLAPLLRALGAGYVQENEWTPMHLLDLSVHLEGLGLPCPLTPPQAAARTVLPLPLPTWLWCYEKVSVLHHLLRSAAAARLPVPPHWRGATHAHLLSAMRGDDPRALSDYALVHALTAQPDRPLLDLALRRVEALLTEAAQDSGTPETSVAARWQRPVSAANSCVIAALLQAQDGPCSGGTR